MVQIILTAIDESLMEAWQRHCGELECVELHRGSILDVECDAIVSPANSFGFMDGGIDLVYSRHFGWDLEERLQARLLRLHGGELLVGQAEIVDSGKLDIPYVISAPTMRVPMVLEQSVNAYLAARGVFLLLERGHFDEDFGELCGERLSDAITRVAFPGLGTGVGRMPADICARQVRVAIERFVLGGFEPPESWLRASEDHQHLYRDEAWDLQLD